MVKSGPIGGRVCWYAKQRGLKQGTFEAVEPWLKAAGTEEERERERGEEISKSVKMSSGKWKPNEVFFSSQGSSGGRGNFFFFPIYF